MIDQKQAEEILKKHLADNLFITEAYENESYWLFELGLKRDDGKLINFLGSNVIKISKDNGTIE